MTCKTWYAALSAAVTGPGTLALVHPFLAIPPLATDDQLWALFNSIPPAILNDSVNLSGGDQFYINYASVLSQLISTALTNFQGILGVYYPLWQRYVVTLDPLPGLEQLPDVFYAWASTNAPSVAVAGRMAIRAAVHDAVFDAQVGVLKISGFLNNTPNFVNGVEQLLTELVSAAGPVKLDFCTSAGNRVRAKIEKLLTFTNPPPSIPEGWFCAPVLQQAYLTPAGLPWRADANPNWQTTFGPRGSLQQFIAALVVAEGIELTRGASSVPPAEAPSLLATPSGSPLVIGVFVQPVSDYLGRALTNAQEALQSDAERERDHRRRA